MKDGNKNKVVNDKTYNSWGTRIGASNYKPYTYEDKKHFYDTYYKDALEAVSGTNISAEVLLSQAYKESNGGRNMPKNNMFGITSISPEKSGIYKTTEYFDTDNYYNTETIDGEIRVKDEYGTDRKLYGVSLVEDEKDKNYGKYKYEVDRYFREYENIKEGMDDYVSNFSKTSNYKKALTELNTTKDQEQFIKNISGSYASTNDYATTLLEHYNDFSGMKEKKSNLNPEFGILPNTFIAPNTSTALSSTIQPVNPNKLRFKKGGLPNGQVEAEGKELVLRNSHGDMAIIPKKYRQEALDMIKEGCNGCLDNLISTLPKVKDYAKDGTVFGIPPNTSTAPSSTIQSVNQNVNTSLIGKTREDIPQYNPGQTFIGPDNRTDYERQRDHEAMNAYQNPGFVGSLLSGARMITRAVADPIQGVGQVFDLVGLGDTRIGQDLGNFNDEEAQYRYRNLNPNIDAGEKFMSNLVEGSNVAAYGATNFIPFESSVINPIVKGLVGKGNYSSYLANPLYTPVVKQGVKEVVEGSVVKQVDDVGKNFKSEIDWSKWNKEIPNNKSLIEEYNAIEETTKANGTWMKNPDGTNFPGTPEQFVQQNSENFKKAFPDGYNKVWRGANNDAMIDRNNTSVFTGNKELAMGYTGMNDIDKFYNPNVENAIIPGRNLFELGHKKSLNSIELDNFGREWTRVDLTNPKQSIDNINRNIKDLEKQVETVKNWLKTGKQNPDGSWSFPDSDILYSDYLYKQGTTEQEKILQSYKDRLKNIDNLIKNPKELEKMKLSLGNKTTTDDIAKYIENADLDYVLIKNIEDGNFGDVSIVNHKKGNYLKSLIGNNGMFDMTNPNIYKSIISAVGTAGAIGASQDK